MNSQRMCLSCFLPAALAAAFLTIGSPATTAAPAKPSKPQIKAAPYLTQLARIGGNLRDVQAVLEGRSTKGSGKKPDTFKAKFYMKLPNSFRFDVLDSSNGMFKNWKLAIVGNNVSYYDPISERASTVNIQRMIGFTPLRMDLGVNMFAGIFRPQNYTVQEARPAKLNGQNTMFLRLKPKPKFSTIKEIDNSMRLSHILVWMDPAKKIPLKEERYGWLSLRNTDKKVDLLASATYGGYRPAGAGVWYPSVVEMTRKMRMFKTPSKVQIRLMRVGNVLFPAEMSTTSGEGTSTIRYSQVRVNTNMPASTFRPQS